MCPIPPPPKFAGPAKGGKKNNPPPKKLAKTTAKPKTTDKKPPKISAKPKKIDKKAKRDAEEEFILSRTIPIPDDDDDELLNSSPEIPSKNSKTELKAVAKRKFQTKAQKDKTTHPYECTHFKIGFRKES